MKSKKVLITGLTGMDGANLAEYLLSLGYQVAGLIRRTSTSNLKNIKNIVEKITLYKGDVLDQQSLDFMISDFEPDEVYHLAAQSFVHDSWTIPEFTFNVNALGTQRILNSLQKYAPLAKFYFAGSSEQFGLVQEIPQKETTPFYPRSPYGISKMAGYWISKNFRESYNMFTCNGLLFNHTCSKRSIEFVEQKIATAAARIKLGLQSQLKLGNLASKRDIGHSKDYIRAMHLMLQQDSPDDYVVATGETHTIEEIVDSIFSYLNLNCGNYVKIDKSLFRPAEVDLLLGDSSKIRKLGWKPTFSFEDIMQELVETALKSEKEKRNAS